MKYIKTYEDKKDDKKIDNPDIINFAKIYNKEQGYSNKSVYYNNNYGKGTYTSIAENPIDNFGYIIVGDLHLEKFIRNAKDDGMSDTLYMRALTDKVNEKYGNSKVINVANDGNSKPDLTKIKNEWNRFFDPIDDKQIVKMMNKEIIIDEGTLNVDKNGKIKTNKKGDSWSIQYKESDDYIFTQFHSGWNMIMKENDFITKFMKDVEYVITANKYNI